MAERAGAAIHIHFVLREVEIADRGERDDRERLVDLVKIDLVMPPADLLQQLLDGADGCRGEPRWFLRVRRVPNNARERTQSVAIGLALAHQDQRGRAV